MTSQDKRNELVLKGKKILITGLTGMVANSVALALAQENDIWGLARFSKSEIKGKLEENGITCVKFDLAEPDFSEVPKDCDYVINFAVSYEPDFDKTITTIVEGLGFLMSHCRNAKAFLHCSTTGVYQFKDHTPITETDPLGDNHKTIMPSYSICKIAAEGVARFAAKHWNIPTTIARLNVPYGDNFGWPYFHMEMILADQPITVHTKKPSAYSPINQDDIIGTIPKLLDVASVPATIVNWAGKEQVSVEDWCELIGQLVEKDVQFTYTEQTLESIIADTTKMNELIGETKTDWREGIKRMVKTMHPELG